MKRILFYLLPILVLLSSCQKEELITREEFISSESVNESTVKNPIASTDAEIQTKAQVTYVDEIIVTAAAAPTPSLNGEIQLFLNKAVSYPVSVQFKIKESLRMGNNLVSGFFTIPAGQRYLTCDIDEYISSTTGSYTSTSIATGYIGDATFSMLITLIEGYASANLLDTYLQIWNIEGPSNNINILANYSILKLSYILDGDGSINVSYPLKAGTVPISTLSNVSGITFYNPTSGTGPINPIRVPFLPTE
jgi:hypothetical protein